jgi:hypothetical protein
VERTSVLMVFALGCASPRSTPPVPRVAAPAPAAAERSWRPLASQPGFAASEMLLLTDGRVMVKDLDSEAWWSLTPDETGSYEHGRWGQLARLPTGYVPLYFASAVLPDGRVIIEGGEYDNSQNPVESKRGAMYDPLADQWMDLSPPLDLQEIGDASGMVLADGRFMLGDCCSFSQLLLDPRTGAWSATGAGKADANSEESWVMLPDGRILTLDCTNANDRAHTEIYDPATGRWSSAGDTPDPLSDQTETGPLVLRPDGTVLAVGDNGHAAVYDIASGTWSRAPDLPMVNGQQLDIADGPGAVMPNGDVLLVASPGLYNPPASIYEWNGTQFTEVALTPNCAQDPSYVAMMLVLPTGEIMMTDFSNDVELYTPAAGIVDAAVPYVTAISGDSSGEGIVSELYRGHSYTLEGVRLNGINQGAYYGDDYQSATNYPLVRVTNADTGHVQFYRTHDHSTMLIGPATEGSTHFDVPDSAERGAATLEVVTNGIASPPVMVDVK